MSIVRKQRPGESWRAYALYLVGKNWTSRAIAERVGRHHTTVLYATNSEYRRDKIRQQRVARMRMSAEDRIQEAEARKHRANYGRMKQEGLPVGQNVANRAAGGSDTCSTKKECASGRGRSRS